jgi:hypothetical protein
MSIEHVPFSFPVVVYFQEDGAQVYTSLVVWIYLVAAFPLMAFTKLNASGSQINRITLPYGQLSLGEWRQLRTRSVTTLYW